MKHLAILFIVAFSLLASCHKQGIDTTLPESDDLYRSWRLTQKLYDGKPIEPDDTFGPLVTFPRDGKFKHGQKDAGWCCNPFSFEGTNAVIRFNWDTSAPDCALINCRLSVLSGGVNWTITNLSATSLILTSDKNVLEFRAEP